jgi:hypothetical protein
MDTLKIITSRNDCSFRLGIECHARKKKVCLCRAEDRRKFPRRCRLREGRIIVERAKQP